MAQHHQWSNQLQSYTERLEQLCFRPKCIFWSFTNEGYVDYALNMFESCVIQGINKHLVMFCLDEASFERCTRHGIQCIPLFVGDVSKQQERWNTHSFNRITFVKFKIVYWLADLGFTSLYTDGDIVFLCDIITKTMEIVDQFDRADIVMQNESRFSDEDMTNFCTGFFVSKPTSAVLQVFHPSNYEMVLDKNDQDLFNESMRQRLVIVGLPRKLFPHGKIISEQPVPQQQFLLMHFNQCVVGEKIQLMKEYGVWYNDLAPDVTKEIIRENLHFMPEHHIYSHETYQLEYNNRFGIRESCDHYMLDCYIGKTQCPLHYQSINSQTQIQSVHVQSQNIPNFARNVLPFITKKFVLVTGSSFDHVELSTDVKRILASPLLVYWYAENVYLKHEKVRYIGIGIDYHYISRHILPYEQERAFQNVLETSKPFSERTCKGFCNFQFNITEFTPERQRCFDTLDKSACMWQPYRMERFESFRRMAECQFVVSPPGRGYDCYRTWEALAVGCVPIVLSSVNDDFYKQFSIMIVEDWTQVTVERMSDFAKTVTQCPSKHPMLRLDYWTRLIASHKVDE